MDNNINDILTEIKGELQSINYFIRRPVVTFQFGLSYKRNLLGKPCKDKTIFTFDIKNNGNYTIEAGCNMQICVDDMKADLIETACFYNGYRTFPVQANSKGHGYLKYRELNAVFRNMVSVNEQICIEVKFWWQTCDGKFASDPELFRYRFDPIRWKLIYDY